MDAGSPQTNEKKTILLIEDDLDVRDTLTALLEYEGYHVAAANHGKEGIEKLDSCNPPAALILLDLMMPVMNGWEFLDHLKHRDANDPFRNVPVIVISATGENKEEQFIVADYIRKPVDVELLLASVAKHCPL